MRSLATGLLCAVAVTAAGQEATKKIETRKQYEIRRAGGPIKIAGELSDAGWSGVEHGYVVEIAVPFSSLRFKETAGTQTWGIDILRIYPRDQRRRIGLNALDRDRNCYVCEFAKLTGFEGVSPGRNLELTPTLTTHRTDVVESFPHGGLKSGDQEVDAGLSAKWGFTPNLTLNAAINPDFSQVEADSPQLDINTQFALFFEEKRPFFLEGADFFRTPLNVVYTRTMADPDWGAKVSGKEGKSAIGAFLSQDAIETLDVEGGRLYTANLTQLRAVYQFNIRTFLRAILQHTLVADLYRLEVSPETRRLFPQLLFSYKINPQTVFFAGYTENRLGDDLIDLTQRDRTFFAKVGYAWLF